MRNCINDYIPVFPFGQLSFYKWVFLLREILWKYKSGFLQLYVFNTFKIYEC